MSDYHAFLRHLLESPEDSVAHLVFADWLEENDQPLRAEFVRISVQWTLSSDTEERKTLGTLRDELQNHHWEAISGGLPVHRRGYRFNFGLPNWVDLSGSDALEHAEAIFAAFPIPRLGLRRIYHQAYEIGLRSWLKHVQEVHFSRDHQLRSIAIAAILRSPYLTNLRRIDLRNLGDMGIICDSLAIQARMHRLRYINLASSGVHVFALRSLCECPSLANVEELDLSNNPLTDSAGITLTRCRFFKRLKVLNLSRPDHLSKPMRKRLRRHFGDTLVL